LPFKPVYLLNTSAPLFSNYRSTMFFLSRS
jgi:hypothetical protein